MKESIATTLRQLYSLGFASAEQMKSSEERRHQTNQAHSDIRNFKPASFLGSLLDVVKPVNKTLGKPSTASPGPASTEEQTLRLRELGRVGEPQVAPWLLVGVFSRSPQVAAASTAAIAAIMRRIPTSKLASLEGLLRPPFEHWYHSTEAYQNLSSDSLSAPEFRDDVEVLGLASFHPSGYVREAACKLLEEGGIRYLLLRLNDWVPQVRKAAHQALNSLLLPHHRELIDCLPLVYRLEDCHRFEDRTFIKKVENRLRQPSAKTAILEALNHPDRSVRQRCYPIALGVHISALELCKKALNSQDLAIRRWGVASARKELSEEQLPEFLETALTNKIPTIRKHALWAWFECVGKPRPDSLLDPSRAVREIAQYHHRDMDREALYQENLGALPHAVLGLVEVGNKDLKLVLSVLQHEELRFKKCALKALSMLKTDGQVLLDHLQSSHPGLSRLSARCLELVPGIRPQVKGIFQISQTDHVLVNSFRLYFKLSGHWERLIFAAEAALHPSLAIREKAIQALCSELGQYRPAYAPSEEFCTELRALESDLTSVLPGDLLRRLLSRLR